jgi:aryl-alcohol dehydrogenase-like predicted oxidoreductase
MELRFLGASGLQVSALSYGAMTFGGGNERFDAMGGTHGDEARRLIDICLEAGVNLFDTADVYSAGRSEEVLGETLAGRRDKVLIATKAFGRTGEGAHDTGLSRRHLIQACEASLRRLKTDWIDLYQVHNFDAVVPVEETLRALDDLVRSGKVRYIGSSNHAGWQLMKTLGVSERLGLARYVGQQIQYSLLVRDAEQELLPAGVDQGVGALIWSPLAQGYLSGKFGDSSARETPTRLTATGGLKSWDNERGRSVVRVLTEIAADHDGASPSQVALNWLLARPGVSTVIIGARNEAQLRDNLAAATWSLSPEEMRRLDLVSQTPVVYPNSHQRFYGGERNPQLFARVKAERG